MESKYKGHLIGFPEEIVEAMMDEQVRQGNPRDVTVFEKNKRAGRDAGGFTWDRSHISLCFWEAVIGSRDFNLFFKKYPRSSGSKYPKVMLVADDCNFKYSQKRVVFMEKVIGHHTYYYAWSDSETLEKSTKAIEVSVWRYAKELPTESTQKEIILSKVDELLKQAEELKKEAEKLST
jgi:hypothetical protein